MFAERGWPANVFYWSSTLDDSSSYYYGVRLILGYTNTHPLTSTWYTSCVSEP
ncbi:hypothetical protein JCM19233_2448 [Vibrio astriarenae]|nr:hypothetical protein JCM19233_2448 [Vibrio sp. C7]